MGATLDYSTTAASNTTVGGVSIAEGMQAGLVNNAIRAAMADSRKWQLDWSGVTTAGTANAYTMTCNQGITAYADGQRFSFRADRNNTGAATLNIDSRGAKALRKVQGAALVALVADDIVEKGIYDVVFNSADDVFVIVGINMSLPALGVTATATELNYVDGVTSAIQTQLDAKQAQDAFLDDIAALTDPGGRRALGWDDTANEVAWIQSNYTWAPTVTTSGAAVYDFGSIPSWVTEIVILLNAVSLTTKTDNIQIRIGTGGTPETTGYTCTTSSIENTATTTNDGAASFFAAPSRSSYVGVCHLYKEPTSNTWMFSGKGRRTGSGGATNFLIDGVLGLSGALDIVRLTRNGASNFNGGFCSVGYR
jgi:hypothetical protein